MRKDNFGGLLIRWNGAVLVKASSAIFEKISDLNALSMKTIHGVSKSEPISVED